MKTVQMFKVVAAVAAVLSLAACGGGGGGSDASGGAGSGASSGTTTAGGSTGTTTTTGTTSVPAGSTQATSTYSSGSVQAQMFTAINTYRAACGFPVFKQNTILDQAAQAHSVYMADNSALVTDVEVQGNPGFTGVSGQDRANALGWPSNIWVGASDAGLFTSGGTTLTQFGQGLVDEWSVGVYHQATITSQAELVGVGATQTTSGSLTGVVGGVELAADGTSVNNITATNSPLTFPCQGIVGVPYAGVAEEPTPPNVSSSGWGTPVTVMGNPTDTIVLTAATIQASGAATVVTMNILTSSNDTSGYIATSQAVAYPSSPLQPNTSYSVNLTGTVNGVAFTRNFTFTTGANAG